MASMRENASIVISAARQMRAIIELAEQIGDIETIEGQIQAQTNEYNAFISKVMDAKKMLADAEKDTAAAKEEAQKLRKDAAVYVKSAKEKADALLKEKTDEANAIAGDIISKAKNEAQSWETWTEGAKKEVAAKKLEAKDLEDKVSKLTAELNKLKARFE